MSEGSAFFGAFQRYPTPSVERGEREIRERERDKRRITNSSRSLILKRFQFDSLLQRKFLHIKELLC